MNWIYTLCGRASWTKIFGLPED